VHAPGRAARALIESVREQLAATLGVAARDVLFTSGGTEANNLALHDAGTLVTSRLEHPSVVKVAERLELAGKTRWLPVPAEGRLEPDAVNAALQGAPHGTWVSVMAANHETGVIQPIEEIAEVVRRHGAHLHVDAVQALGKLELTGLDSADRLTVCAHKLRGPKGIGALLWRGGHAPKPLLTGGAQERGLRPGTQDAVLAAGFLATLERLEVKRHADLAVLRDELEVSLDPWCDVNGARELRLPHVTNLSFRGWLADELVAALDLEGVCVSAGSACSAGTTEPSPVITSMLGQQRAASAVRFSLGELTTPSEIEITKKVLRNLLSSGSKQHPSADG
jgi:cysteine desulfurase